MNVYGVKDKQLNNGEETKIVSAYEQEEFRTQFVEMFNQDQYGPGRVKRDMNIIDLGGNCGLAALYFKDWAKKLVSFEPNAIHFLALQQNIAPYPHLSAISKAVSLGEGRDFMGSGKSGFAERLSSREGVRQIVDIITMEQALDEAGMEHVDLLKIDIEGAEFGLFLSEPFERCVPRIDHIVGELHFEGSMVPDLAVGLLQKYGYEVEIQPSQNISLGIYIDNGDGTRSRTYERYFDTIFFARRK